MLKILFSPSEGKKSGGNEIAKELLGSNSARDSIFNEYNSIMDNADEETIKSLFGFKKYSECIPYRNNLFNTPLMCAIERYRGVAYDYLEYDEMKENEKEFLKTNVIIFSNLYGAILGGVGYYI